MAKSGGSKVTVELIEGADRQELYRMILPKMGGKKSGFSPVKMGKMETRELKDLALKLYGLDGGKDAEAGGSGADEGTTGKAEGSIPAPPPKPVVADDAGDDPAADGGDKAEGVVEKGEKGDEPEVDEVPKKQTKRRRSSKKATEVVVDLSKVEDKLNQISSSLYDLAEAVQLLMSKFEEQAEAADIRGDQTQSKLDEMLSFFRGDDYVDGDDDE